MKKAVSFALTNRFYRTGFLVMLIGLVFLSCAQDSIFYNLSNEVKPKDPRIPGSPTSMVVLNKTVYIGTYVGLKVYSFDGSTWNPIALAGGSTGGLATDGTYLYALVFPNRDPRGSPIIRKYDGVGAWETISFPLANDYWINSIYSADGQIFAGAQERDPKKSLSFSILYLDPADSALNVVMTESATSVTSTMPILNGAAVDGQGNMYLSTGSGIYEIDSASMTDSAAISAALDNTAVSKKVSSNVKGIIAVGGVITGVTSSGRIYILDPTAATPVDYFSTGYNYTGGMGIWKGYNTPAVVPGVTVTPSVVTVHNGASMQFSAVVTGVTSDHSVHWSVSGGSGQTGINQSGLLTVDEAETGPLTVTAVSAADSSLSAAAQVTIAGEDELDGWIGITGTPWPGGTLTAAVDKLGSGTENLTFRWERDGAAIADAGGSSYLIDYIDAGHSISVTASRADGSAVSSAVFAITQPSTDLWQPKLLLMGIQDAGSSLTQGYRELVLINGKPAITSSVREPGDSTPPPTSVSNQAKYEASIGIRAVTAIMQVPDKSEDGPLDYNYLLAGNPKWEPIIFGSTSQSGLFSYRNGEWNAE